MENKKFRSRVFNLLLYTDNEKHLEIEKNLLANYDIALIHHDSDLDDNGNLKKEHVHCVVQFENQKWNTALSDELGLELNLIQESRSFKNSLLYLVHFNDPEKYQYSTEDIKGNLKSKVNKFINDLNKSEEQQVLELINYIDYLCGYTSITDFSAYCAINGYWGIYRRSYSIWKHIIDEHNKNFINKQNNVDK